MGYDRIRPERACSKKKDEEKGPSREEFELAWKFGYPHPDYLYDVLTSDQLRELVVVINGDEYNAYHPLTAEEELKLVWELNEKARQENGS